MATEIDALSIEIVASAQKANKSLDELVDSCDNLVKSLRNIKGVDTSKLINSKNLSTGTNAVRKTMSDLMEFTDDFNSKLAQAGKNKGFEGTGKQLEAEITRAEKKFDDLLAKEQKYIALDKNIPNSKAWKSLQYDIAETANYLDTLYDKQKEMQNVEPFELPKKNIPNVEYEQPEVKQPETSYNSLKTLREKFGSLQNLPTYSMDTSLLDAMVNKTNQAEIEASELANSIEDVGEELQEVGSKSQSMIELTNMVKLLKSTFSKIPLMLSSIGKSKALSKIPATLSSSFGKVMPKILKNFNSMASKMGNSFKGISKKLSSSFGNVFKGLMKFPKMLFSMTMFSAIFKIMEEATQQVANLNAYSEKMGTGFSKSLDSITSSFKYLGRSIITAFEPILNAVAPILDFIVQKFVSVINVVNQLFNALTGSNSWTKATYQAEEYGEEVSNAADEQKKFNGQLSKVDELNVLSSGKDSGGSGGASAVDASGFKTEEVPNSVKNIAEKLKEAWKNADFTGIGAMIGDKLNTALESIDWEKIKKTASNIAKSISTFLNGFIATTDWKVVGKTLAEGFNTILSFLYTAITTFDWIKLGKSILETIGGFLQNLDWSTLGKLVVIGVGTSIALSGISALVTSIVGAIGTALSALATTGAALAPIITGLVAVISAAIVGVKIGETIYEAITGEEVDLSELIEFDPEVIKGAIKLAWEDVKKWWSKNIVAPVISFKATIATKWSDLKDKWNALKSKVTGKTVDFKAKVATTFSELKEKFRKLLNNLIAWVNKNIVKINTKLVITAPKNKLTETLGIDGKKYTIAQIPYLPSFQTGGFPEDGLFMANHNELVGRFSNGRTAVANNEQITKGIAQAVYNANREVVTVMQQELSETRTQNELLRQLLVKETGISYKDIGRASQKFASEYSAINGRPAYI